MHGQDRSDGLDGEQLDDDRDPPYPATGEQLPEIAVPSIQRRDVLPPSADDAAAIDSFLSGYGRGYQVSIVRTAPVWCAGYLTTLPMDHGITLTEIRESYGGRRFQLRILTDAGKYVAMRTVLIADVPREDGKPIATLDRGNADAPKANPAPAASGFGELAGVLRDLLASQQAASDRQAEMLERLIMQPAAQAQAAIASPLEQIQQFGEMIRAVREITPAIAAGSEVAEGGTGETLMMKLAEQLINKWGSGGEKAAAPPKGRGLPPGRAPGAPGARPRAPIIIQGPRPAGIPAPRSAPAPIVPNATTIAAMREARTMGQPEAAPIPGTIPAAIAEGEPVANPQAPDLEPVNESSISQLAENEHGSDEEYTAEDVRDLLAGMPVDDAAEVIRDVFDGLNDEEKQRAIAILVAPPSPELQESPPDEVDDSSSDGR
jgi:hypothetical protein